MDDPTESRGQGDQANENLHEPTGLTDAGTADAAADEHAERHRRGFARRIEAAHEALLNGKAAALAYVLGISEKDVERLGGVTDGRDTTSRSAYGELEPDDSAGHP